MLLTIYIDPRLGDNQKIRAAYVWRCMAEMMGISALITEHIRDTHAVTGPNYKIYYGYQPHRGEMVFDLCIPFKPEYEPLKVRWFNHIPVFYGTIEPSYLELDNTLGFDPVSASFDLLSGAREYQSSERDNLARHPEENATISILNLFEKPVVNIWTNLIRDLITKKSGRKAGLPLWPEGKTFAVALTHDVDSVSRNSFSTTRNVLRNARWESSLFRKVKYMIHGVRSFFLTPVKFLTRHDPLWFYDPLIQLESKYGVRSTLFALPPHGDVSHYLDWLYAYEEKVMYQGRWMQLQDAFRRIAAGGWEIGLHGGLDSFRQADVLCSQKESLEKKLNLKVDSIRQHYLRFAISHTWETQADAGFRCDSTYGFNRHLGFRAGCCLPYRPFSQTGNQVLNMWELPLTIQDNALFVSRGQTLDRYYSDAIHLLSQARDVNGVATLLWHTNAVWDRKYPGWLDVYDRIIHWAVQHNAMVGSVREIINWWQARCSRIDITCNVGVGPQPVRIIGQRRIYARQQ